MKNELRKIVIGIVGFLILLTGIAMIVLPGPAIVVIPLGLTLLATEFAWAKKLLKKFKEEMKNKGLIKE